MKSVFKRNIKKVYTLKKYKPQKNINFSDGKLGKKSLSSDKHIIKYTLHTIL